MRRRKGGVKIEEENGGLFAKRMPTNKCVHSNWRLFAPSIASLTNLANYIF